MSPDRSYSIEYQLQSREEADRVALEAIRYQLRGQPGPRVPLSHQARLSKKKRNRATGQARKSHR